MPVSYTTSSRTGMRSGKGKESDMSVLGMMSFRCSPVRNRRGSICFFLPLIGLRHSSSSSTSSSPSSSSAPLLLSHSEI